VEIKEMRKIKFSLLLIILTGLSYTSCSKESSNCGNHNGNALQLGPQWGDVIMKIPMEIKHMLIKANVNAK
jgi:hypothetical protein